MTGTRDIDALGGAVVATKHGTNFPTLSFRCQVGKDVNETKPFLANSTAPLHFSTDLFTGKLLLLTKTPNGSISDPIYQERIFEKKNRTVSTKTF